MQFNLCLIGAGRIGKIHAANFARDPRAALKYIVDPYGPAAKALAEEHGAQVATVEEALADPDVKGVIIASATDTHADLIEQAARAGKAVFCEKPVDLTVERAEASVAVAEREEQPLFLGFNRRFDPHFQTLKGRIDAGAIGDVEMVHITSRDPSPPPAEYSAVSGGLFKDMMIHDLDMARWLLGEEPVAITTSASCLIDPAIGEAGDVDSAVVTLRTQSGKLCVISNSRRASYGYDQRLEVHGSKGRVMADNVTDSLVSVADGGGSHGDKIQHFFLERYAAAYCAEADHFLRILAGQETPLSTGDDGVKALKLAEAAKTALDTGTTVLLD